MYHSIEGDINVTFFVDIVLNTYYIDSKKLKFLQPCGEISDGISCLCYYVYYWIKKRYEQQMSEYIKCTTSFSYVITKKKFISTMNEQNISDQYITDHT